MKQLSHSKVCVKCNVEKPTSDYYKDVRYRLDCKNICKKCMLNVSDAQKKTIRKYIQDYKMSKGCTDCSYKEHPRALEFDHRPDEEKLFTIGSTSGNNYGLKKFKQEMNKCDVVCANCHAIRTASREEGFDE